MRGLAGGASEVITQVPAAALPNNFEGPYSHYYDQLMRSALRITGSVEVAEEAVQEAAISIWRNIDRFKPRYPAHLRDWMSIIVKRSALQIRREEDKQTKAVNRLGEYSIISAEGDSLLQNLHGELEEHVAIQDLFFRLEECGQKALLMHAMGYEMKEIADELEIKRLASLSQHMREDRKTLARKAA